MAAAAALRGSWRVLGETLKMGRNAIALRRELRARLELLAEAEAASDEWREAA